MVSYGGIGFHFPWGRLDVGIGDSHARRIYPVKGLMQQLLFFQSLWAMESRQPGCPERSLEEKIELIAAAGYDGISTSLSDPDQIRRLQGLLPQTDLAVEGVCFPRNIEDLAPLLDMGTQLGVHHLTLQPDVRPRRLQECLTLIEGWRRLSEQVRFPVYFETHRDRMTTDLYFTLDLLDHHPELPLVADLSHYLVGREFAWPVSDENHALMHRILDCSWAIHGRVASREQVQVELSFPQHKMWLNLFLEWWRYGFQSWRRRAQPDATLAFVCELGPRPYAITGADGKELADRWSEALLLRQCVTAVWKEVIANNTPPTHDA